MARLCTHMSIFLNETVLQNLKQRKIYTVTDLLKENPEKLVSISELSYKEVLQIRHSIIANYSAFPHKGINMYNDLVTNSALISTGIQSLDNILEGGFLTGNLYELCGLSGAGKTQLCLTIAVNAAQHLKQHVHYIDGKLDFSGKRVQAMLSARGCDDDVIGTTLERIQVTRIQDVFKLFSFLHMLKDNLHHEQDGTCSVRVVIIDSLPVFFFPFLGEVNNDGLGLLNQLASTLKYIATEYHVAFLLVNLATKWIDEEISTFETCNVSRDPAPLETLRPALGKYWMHVPSTRLYVKKNESEEVHISVMKSTHIKVGTSCTVTIANEGIRELFIMFVYDTQRCLKEEDDPQEAVLYFHPTWVSDQQRLALCGQLMGATQFFISAFSCPRILALNSGKFVVRQFGRYILTVGTDRNIPDWVLQHRADSLHHLVQFYHRDFMTISSLSGSDGNQFVEKLTQIFETYVPIIQFAGNIFGNIPTIRLPKSASNIFLEAIQILHCCQEKQGVLGGVVLYQNKVVATQLSSDLTKRLVSTDPYRIKTSAENVATPFHLPMGVQMLHVYVDNKEYNKLVHNSASARSAFDGVTARKVLAKKATPVKVPLVKEQMSSMKRDTSRIFTVPEEKEGEIDIAEDITVGHDLNMPSECPTPIREVKEKSLTECVPLRDIKYRSISELPSPLRETRIRSVSESATPLRDINLSKVLHAKVLSICRGSEEEETGLSVAGDKKKKKPTIPDVPTDSTNVKGRTGKLKTNKSIRNFLVNCSENEVHSLSLNDLHQSTHLSSKRVPMRYYSFGLPRLTHDMCEDDESNNSPTEKVTSKRHFYNTITDPIYPFFRYDGLPISGPLFGEYLAHHYQLLGMERSTDTSPSESGSGRVASIVSGKLDFGKSEKEENDEGPFKVDSNKQLSEQTEEKLDQDSAIPSVVKEVTSSKQEIYRRSLSLPLKTLTTNEYDDDDMRRRSTSYTAGVLESPAVRTKMLGGLQLTPLMSKLSLLAMEEKTSGFCSRETTPSEFRDFGFPGTSEDSSTSRSTKQEKRTEQEAKSEASGLQLAPEKAVLYVCGQQNMALLLLLEEGLDQDPELIHSLWETSLSGLSRLEIHLRQCLEYFPQVDGGEPYSFLCMDPSWDMLQRGGPWGSLELDVVSSLHHDFTQSSSLTEVVLRCEDSTVYGYQCGKTEVFYQQPAGNTVGLPTPSDLMGIVPLKARRRLERDHGIILL